jgi:dTDP-4-amino-4,6-dideoxygalactose transaminase
VLESGSWSGYNRQVEGFEAVFADLHKASNAISCSSRTLEFEGAPRSLGIRCGDEAIVPGITFVATVSTVLLCHGASVVDIDPARLNMCPQCFEAAPTARTRAIIAAHFGRQPADIDALRDIADRDYLALIEDAAHAYGAYW